MVIRLSTSNTTYGKMYGAVASNLADKGRDQEIKVMSFIHGRALQLQYYIPGDIKLGDVIPDAPVGFANLVVSFANLLIYRVDM